MLSTVMGEVCTPAFQRKQNDPLMYILISEKKKTRCLNLSAQVTAPNKQDPDRGYVCTVVGTDTSGDPAVQRIRRQEEEKKQFSFVFLHARDSCYSTTCAVR